MCPGGTWARRGQSDLEAGSETSGGRGQRPPRRLSDRESAPNSGRGMIPLHPALCQQPESALSLIHGKARIQTVEKTLVLERAAFLASFGRSQRSRKMLRHKALGLCPKPRQARREACALWALGPKAQSDPQRGSETMSATVREARMIEQPMIPLHPALCQRTEPREAGLRFPGRAAGAGKT